MEIVFLIARDRLLRTVAACLSLRRELEPRNRLIPVCAGGRALVLAGPARGPGSHKGAAGRAGGAALWQLASVLSAPGRPGARLGRSEEV